MSRSKRTLWSWLSLAFIGIGSTAAAEEQRVEHSVVGDYDAEVSMFTDGTTSAAAAAISGDLGYAASLIGDAGPIYDVETGAGLMLGRMQGTISTTQARTRAHLRIGPAVVPPSEDRYNMTYLPYTFELEHDGELGALPQLSSRPDTNRAVFNRGQLSLATRGIRVEVGETKAPESERAPGETKPAEPVSSAIDFVTFYGDVEATVQDGTRVEAGVGGALVSVTNRHTHGERVDVFALEHRASRLPDGTTTSIATLGH